MYDSERPFRRGASPRCSTHLRGVDGLHRLLDRSRFRPSAGSSPLSASSVGYADAYRGPGRLDPGPAGGCKAIDSPRTAASAVPSARRRGDASSVQSPEPHSPDLPREMCRTTRGLPSPQGQESQEVQEDQGQKVGPLELLELLERLAGPDRTLLLRPPNPSGT